MKSTVELEVALRGLRGRSRKTKPASEAVLDLWVEEALARNYWRQLSEDETEKPLRSRRAVVQGEAAANAA